MAGGQERILRRRIKSVQATKKITRAMELIAGVPDRARPAARRTPRCPTPSRSPRSSGTWPRPASEAESPLLQARPEIKKVCYVVMVADRGLCGAYNANVLRAAEGEIKQDVLDGLDYAHRRGRPQGRELLPVPRATTSTPPSPASATTPPTPTPRQVADWAVERFVAGEVDRVRLVYTRFVSAGFQEVVTRPLAPLEAELVERRRRRPSG